MEAGTITLSKRELARVVETAALVLEYIPLKMSSSDLAPGRKIVFPIPLKSRPRDMADFLYVFAECKIDGTPKDQVAGYTEDDLVKTTGIYLFRRQYGAVMGSSCSLNWLLYQITDLSLRHRIINRVQEMENAIRVDDEFLDMVNKEYRVGKIQIRSTLH